MKVSTRLIVSLGGLGLLLVLLSVVGLWATSSARDVFAAACEVRRERVHLVERMRTALQREAAGAFAAALGDDSGLAQRTLSAGRTEFLAALGEQRDRSQADPSIVQLLEPIERAHAQLSESVEPVLRSPPSRVGTSQYHAEVAPRLHVVEALVRDLDAEVQRLDKLSHARAERTASAGRVAVSVASALACAAMIWIAAHVVRKVADPLAQIAQTCRALRGGEPHRRLRPGSDNELGTVAATINDLADRAERSERRLREADAALDQAIQSIVDSFSEPTAVADAGARARWTNAAFAQCVEPTGRGTIGTSIDEIGAACAATHILERRPLAYRGLRAFGELVLLRARSDTSPPQG